MSAPERIYLTTNKSDGEWSNVSQRTVPDWLSKHVDEHQYIRADIHEAEIDALKAELAALKAPPKVLSAEEVTEPGWYWWKKIGADDFDEPVQVFEDEHYITHDPILIISRIGCVGAISQECWKGQFIGPIQMPEV